MSFPTTLICTALKAPYQGSQETKDRKSIKIRKKDIKLSLFVDNTILCIENMKTLQKTHYLNSVKFQNTKSLLKKSGVFLYAKNKLTKD